MIAFVLNNNMASNRMMMKSPIGLHKIQRDAIKFNFCNIQNSYDSARFNCYPLTCPFYELTMRLHFFLRVHFDVHSLFPYAAVGPGLARTQFMENCN